MADAIDLAQQREQEERERFIAHARRRTASLSSFFCEECDAVIPEARRIAVPGVTLCVFCQQIKEMKNKHYREN
ncbi:TraR/DksA C4-type zinc finger protein [Cronobacter malonaticus]